MSSKPDDRRPDTSADGLSRRDVLGLGAAAVAASLVPIESFTAGAAAAGTTRPKAGMAQVDLDALRPDIRPRSDWAGELGVKGEIAVEDDVRFLLVHHTASSNAYQADAVIDQIRGFYDFHTGPEKGWPDVAYNFFVDRFGGIWEGRAGSIDGPVRGDATGGSQGFALLCSLIGNHQEEPVTPQQQDALVRLLAWLAERHGIDTAPEAEVSFVSRGSSRWPEGTEVTASTISGHRDMSTTTCPGDFAYPLLADEIPSAVSLVRAAAGSTQDPTTTSTPTSTTGAEPGAEDSATSTSTSTSTPTSAPTSSSISSPTSSPDEAAAAALDAEGGAADGRSIPLIIAGTIAAVVAAGGAVITRLTGRSDQSS